MPKFWRKVNKGVYVSPNGRYLATKNEEFISGFTVEEFDRQTEEWNTIFSDISLKGAEQHLYVSINDWND